MNQKNALLLLLCLIRPAIPQGQQPLSAAASQIIDGRNLAQQADESNPKEVKETSPSPIPDPAVPKPKSGDDKVANPPKTLSDSEETCDLNQCRDYAQNIIAFLLPKVGDASRGLFLLVRNVGENSLKLMLPVDCFSLFAMLVGDILEHQSKKIDISSNAGRNSVIVLNAANWTCTVGVVVSFPSYIASIKPINGLYLLFGTALLVGVFWGCCKVGKDMRHLNGVPYQELEMGQQENGESMNVESVDGWNESWDDDDDWDEEKVLRSGGGNNKAIPRNCGIQCDGSLKVLGNPNPFL